VCVWCKQIKCIDVEDIFCKSTKEKFSKFYHFVGCEKLILSWKRRMGLM
jgi:hypothetical protein